MDRALISSADLKDPHTSVRCFRFSCKATYLIAKSSHRRKGCEKANGFESWRPPGKSFRLSAPSSPNNLLFDASKFPVKQNNNDVHSIQPE